MDRRSRGMTSTRAADPPRDGLRGAVIAVATEDDRYARVRERAADLARTEGRPVVLYDWDAPSPIASPVPTWWSGDGPGEQPAGPLDEHDLEMAGRAPIARQVRQLRARGIAVGGWLPTNHGGAALQSFAMSRGAAAIVVPADLDDAGVLLSPTIGMRIITVPAGDRR